MKKTVRKPRINKKVPTPRKPPVGYAVGLRPEGARLRSIPEKMVLAACKQYLSTQKKWWWKRIDSSGKLFNGALARSDAKGMPDLILLGKGVFIAVELKRPWGGHLSLEQAECLSEIIANGGLGAVVTSVNGLMLLMNGVRASCYIETHAGAIPFYA